MGYPGENQVNTKWYLGALTRLQDIGKVVINVRGKPAHGKHHTYDDQQSHNFTFRVIRHGAQALGHVPGYLASR